MERSVDFLKQWANEKGILTIFFRAKEKQKKVKVKRENSALTITRKHMKSKKESYTGNRVSFKYKHCVRSHERITKCFIMTYYSQITALKPNISHNFKWL